jgi:hypothetical protein
MPSDDTYNKEEKIIFGLQRKNGYLNNYVLNHKRIHWIWENYGTFFIGSGGLRKTFLHQAAVLVTHGTFFAG